MRVLIVRVSSLGDVVHNMPMVADILRHHPAAQIDWVVEEAYVPLVRLNQGVRRIVPFALRRWRRSLTSNATRAELAQFRRDLRAEAYDIVFDTQGLVKTAVVMRMARLAPGGRRVGLANATEGSGYEPLSRVFHTQSIPVARHAHAVSRARTVAAQALGYVFDDIAGSAENAVIAADASLGGPDFGMAPPALSRSASAWLPSMPYVVFFHGTARIEKSWAPAHWIAIGRLLAERGLPLLLPWGSAAEKSAAAHLAAHVPGAMVLPQLTMMDAVLLAQRAALVIGVDTGLTHIAAAFTRPTIELYCDSPRWKTEGNWSPQIINLGDAGMPPSVAHVADAVQHLLGNAA